MAQLPPDNRPFFTKWWHRFCSLSWKLRVTIFILVILLVSGGVCVGFYIWSQNDGSVNANSLIGFVGGVLASSIGGLFTLLVLWVSLRNERAAVEAARERDVDRHRVELASQFADVVESGDLLSGSSTSRRRARRLLNLIDWTWTDGHGGRVVVTALDQGLTKIVEAAVYNEYEAITPEERREVSSWVAEELVPAMAGVADAIGLESIVGPESPSGIPPTVRMVKILDAQLRKGAGLLRT